MSSIEPLKTLILDLPPSCIEFWPQHPQYAVIGTYNLEKTTDEVSEEVEDSEERASDDDQSKSIKKSQKRDGSLILVQVEGDEVHIIHTKATPSAILDVHFFPFYEGPAQDRNLSRFAVATSTGSIDIYSIDQTGSTPQLRHEKICQITDLSTIITSFAFHPTAPVALVTYTTGDVRTLNLVDGEVQDGASIQDHSLEAWTATFGPSGTEIYSGGDDSVLMRRNFPNVEGFGGMEDGGWADRKIHGAGVTAILPLEEQLGEDLVVTGSYDDHIRLIWGPVVRVGRRSVLAELNLGGGVWRLKRLDMKSTSDRASAAEGDTAVITILASCMHAGVRIVTLTKKGEEWYFEVIAKFEEHKSMNYGSDVQPSLNEQGRRAGISTSFYDRMLCLWTAPERHS